MLVHVYSHFIFPPLLATGAQGQHKPGVALGAADRDAFGAIGSTEQE